MKRFLLIVCLLATTMTLSACVAWSRVPAKQTKLSGGLVLHPENEWSAMKYGAAQTWTVHGPQIEAITVVSGLKDGKSIAQPVNYKDKMPLFRSAMSASEVAELMVETLLRMGYGKVDLLGVRPETFAGRPGFRFDLDLVAANGLSASGLGAGVIANGKLYLIVYRAPKLHYFDKYKTAVEKLVASAQIPD